MAQKTDFTEWLADNPRMMGALFTLTLLLSQAGNTLAAGGGARYGP
jgi:hypothetical protein